MLEALPDTISVDTELPLALVGLGGALVLVGSWTLPRLITSLLDRFLSFQIKEAYQTIIEPYKGFLGLVLTLLGTDFILFLIPKTKFVSLIELPISLALAIAGSWLGSRLFKRFFDFYLLDAAIKSGRKVNSELLILAKLLANFLIVVLAVVIFAQTHQINILGLVASLGVGGLAVAFAAQKTLEQFLGGIVIYLDRPFVIDDYIGLPDGTFGRVESIGLRSTKIRTSGKGTLMVVPNSVLTQVNIENFTGAKKVMSLIYLTFYRTIPNEERALIRQVILESTGGIFGIDARSTNVTFKDVIRGDGQKITQSQITFFILGSGEVSMDLRRQLLDIANQTITKQLKEYGIAFDIEEPTIYVDSPITI
jgi:MscS family membrane protein